MPRIAIYTATENELGAIQRAAEEVETDLTVRSEGDLDDLEDADAFVDRIVGGQEQGAEPATAAVFWLHGAEDSMPGYEHAVKRVREAGIPLIVKATGDAFAFEDTSVPENDRETVYEYLDRGGTANLANLVRYLVDEYGDESRAFDDPVALPTEGVYHPDHPGASYEELRATLDPGTPTVGVWFYESRWTHENTRYVDALVRAIEAQGADALPVFCNPATDTDEQEDAEWSSTTGCWRMARRRRTPRKTERRRREGASRSSTRSVRRSCSRCRWTNGAGARATRARAPKRSSSTGWAYP